LVLMFMYSGFLLGGDFKGEDRSRLGYEITFAKSRAPRALSSDVSEALRGNRAVGIS